MVHTAQHEEELRLLVQPGAYAIQHCGEILAQVCPIGTRTSLFNLGGFGKQPFVPVSDNAKDRAREAALEQFDQGVDLSGTFVFDGLPAGLV
jgi:hypothetical protein